MTDWSNGHDRTLLNTVTVVKHDGQLWEHEWRVYWDIHPDVTGWTYTDPKTKKVWTCVRGIGLSVCFERPAGFISRLRYYLGLVPNIHPERERM